jgi:hypothetical protein
LVTGGARSGLLRLGRTLGIFAQGAFYDEVCHGCSELALELQLPCVRQVQLAPDFVGGCDSFAFGSIGLGGPPLRRTLGL